MQDMNIWIFQNSKSIFIYADTLRTPRLFRYICFDNWLRVVNLHESYNNAIKDRTGNANICDTKLKSCVQQHRVLIEYCRKLENIFMVIVLGQVIFLLRCMPCGISAISDGYGRRYIWSCIVQSFRVKLSQLLTPKVISLHFYYFCWKLYFFYKRMYAVIVKISDYAMPGLQSRLGRL